VTTVSLRLDGPAAADPVAPPPRRYPLSPAALEELARLTRLTLPWRPRAEPSPLARALGEVPPRPLPPAGDDGAVVELTRLGLLSTAGRPDSGLVAALEVFAAPEVFVEIDLAVRRRERPGARFRGWHRYRHGDVTALSVTGGSTELAWWTDRWWPHELTHLVTPPPCPDVPAAGAPDSPPAAFLRLPYELLLGSAAARREQRPGVLAELLDRHAGAVRGGDGTPYSRVAVEDQLRRLHGAVRGRLLVTVAGAGGRRILGTVSWVLFADGWRELTPAPGAGEPMVDVRAVAPAHLGGRVALLVSGVRR
jgi:hypothetical protein